MRDLDDIFIDLDSLADNIISQLQGTMGLEGQTLPQNVLDNMKKKTLLELHKMLGNMVHEKVYGMQNQENTN